MANARDDDQRELIPGRAQGYVRDGDGRLRNSALTDTSYKVPGGGLCATAADVARFGSALVSGPAAPAGDPRPDADAAENT